MNANEIVLSAAGDIFASATCQRDVDARVGEFVAALRTMGIEVLERGQIQHGTGPQGQVRILNWHLKVI